ncbi:MAG: hypothetical protein KAT35_04190 [Candidatus Aenigmarchaeota archaeon]|nr:hypothetical protein [Candidatus Aenigmarchaeota archaeon]
MIRAFVLGISMALLVPGMAAAQSDLVLELQVNDTSHTLYESAEHSYVASFLSGMLIGLAGAGGTHYTQTGTSYNTLGFERELGEPVFLVFSQGDWQVIENRMDDIESGDFMDYVSPSFGFGLGSYHPLKVVLSYAGIDLDGGIAMSRGIYKLVIENKGESGGRTLVEIRG